MCNSRATWSYTGAEEGMQALREWTPRVIRQVYTAPLQSTVVYRKADE